MPDNKGTFDISFSVVFFEKCLMLCVPDPPESFTDRNPGMTGKFFSQKPTLVISSLEKTDPMKRNRNDFCVLFRMINHTGKQFPERTGKSCFPAVFEFPDGDCCFIRITEERISAFPFPFRFCQTIGTYIEDPLIIAAADRKRFSMNKLHSCQTVSAEHVIRTVKGDVLSA